MSDLQSERSALELICRLRASAEPRLEELSRWVGEALPRIDDALSLEVGGRAPLAEGVYLSGRDAPLHAVFGVGRDGRVLTRLQFGDASGAQRWSFQSDFGTTHHAFEGGVESGDGHFDAVPSRSPLTLAQWVRRELLSLLEPMNRWGDEVTRALQVSEHAVRVGLSRTRWLAATLASLGYAPEPGADGVLSVQVSGRDELLRRLRELQRLRVPFAQGHDDLRRQGLLTGEYLVVVEGFGLSTRRAG